jgi:hypothetical protein
MKALTSGELVQLAQTLGLCVGRFPERQELLERDAGGGCLAVETLDQGPLNPFWGHSINHRFAVGSQQGRKAFALQMLPVCDEPWVLDRLSEKGL